MPDRSSTEAFFRPAACLCLQTTIPAALYNLCRLCLARSEGEYCFVPIRTMQYLAVISREEILFIDSQDYAVVNGQGGRLITLAWLTTHTGERDSLDAPVPIEVVYYREDCEDIQRRLLGEFRQALQTLHDRDVAASVRAQQGARIIRI